MRKLGPKVPKFNLECLALRVIPLEVRRRIKLTGAELEEYRQKEKVTATNKNCLETFLLATLLCPIWAKAVPGLKVHWREIITP